MTKLCVYIKNYFNNKKEFIAGLLFIMFIGFMLAFFICAVYFISFDMHMVNRYSASQISKGDFCIIKNKIIHKQKLVPEGENSIIYLIEVKP